MRMGVDLGTCAIAAIGSGGPYALAAARALIALPDYDAKTIGEHKAFRYHLPPHFISADTMDHFCRYKGSQDLPSPLHTRDWHLCPTVWHL